MSFRFSHYFVAFLGQTLMLAGGTVPTSQLLGPLGGSRAFGMSTTEPWLVEVPRSLVRVVVVWNRPMHYWLKTCECWRPVLRMNICNKYTFA